MTEIRLALQSAREALKDCNDKLAIAVEGLDKLTDSGQDTPVPSADVERVHAQCLAMARLLDRIVR